MTTEYLLNREVGHVLAALTPANALVMRVCLHTGLRVGDVLALRTIDLCPSRPTHQEGARRGTAAAPSKDKGAPPGHTRRDPPRQQSDGAGTEDGAGTTLAVLDTRTEDRKAQTCESYEVFSG